MTDPGAPPVRRPGGGFLSFERQLRMAYGLGLVLALTYAALIIRSAAAVAAPAGLPEGAVGTLGYDYLAYDLAIDRLLAGQPLYDTTATEFGPFGLYFYPPPFLLFVLPVALLPTSLAIWTWTLLLIAAAVAAIVILPVSRRTRWWTGLLAALSWPLLYAVKLGQIGPIALLLFAIGWRWLGRAWPLGLSIGLGTIAKIQPALLIGWAVVTGRRRAAAIAIGVVVVLAAVGTVLVGPQSWFDLAGLLVRVSKPLETAHHFGVGRLAFEAGASVELATLLQWANLALVAAVVIWTVLRGSAAASYLAVATASQFLSPVLWDHYAIVLLLPTAWLLERGRLWAALIPAVTSTPLLLAQVAVPAAYPLSFWAALLALAWEGSRDRRADTRDRVAEGTREATEPAVI